MLRFAPSPTGDMHISDLRVALLNYIVSQQKKEDFIVRIEDTDKEKNIEGKDQEILALLDLFNIKYSQIIYQSESARFHSAMALQLMHEKKAFSCFCSSEWLAKKYEEANAAKKVYNYDDACRNLPAELVIDNTSPFTIRVARPESTLTIQDKIQGEIHFEPNSVDSFIILNQEKTPRYNFACAVDDMLSDISIIIRSQEHLDNTPKQEHIRASLSYEKKIQYAHLPIILNAKNEKMSIEDDGASVKWLLEQGYLPEAILNYLISMGNKATSKSFTIEEAVEWFDLSMISSTPVRFDINALKQINQNYLKSLDAKELSRYVGFADIEIGELARIYLGECSTTVELKAKISSIFTKQDIGDEFTEQIVLLKKIIKSAPYFEEYSDFESYIMDKSGLKDENFSKPLRIILTNASQGPDIAMIYKYLKNYIGEIVK